MSKLASSPRVGVQLSVNHLYKPVLTKLLGNVFLYLTTVTAKKFHLYLTQAFLAATHNCSFYIYNRSYLQLLYRTFNFLFLCDNVLCRIRLIPAPSLVFPWFHRHCLCNCFPWNMGLAPLIAYCSSLPGPNLP